jgi:PAS domain S-box-containing protein
MLIKKGAPSKSNIGKPALMDTRIFYQKHNESFNIKFLIDNRGRILAANKAFIKAFGNDNKKYGGKRIQALFGDTDVNAIISKIKETRAKRNFVIDAVRLKKNYSGGIYELKLTKFKNGLWFCSLNETKVTKNNTEIRLLISALNSIKEAMVITDLEGNIKWVNNSFSKITQYKLGEIKNKNPRILKSGIQDNKFYKDMWDTIKSGKTWEGRLFNKRKDGSIYLDEQVIYPYKNGKNGITHFICIKSDISNRSYTNEKMLAQNNLLNILSDAVITTDEKLNITGSNKGAEIIFGIPSADLLGRSAIDLTGKGLTTSSRNIIIKSLMKKGNYKFDSLITTKSSMKRSIETSASVLKDNTGRITGYIFLIRNIKDGYIKFSQGVGNNKYSLSSVYDSISQPVMIFDREFKIVASNRLFLERLNLQPIQLYQKKIDEVFKLPVKYVKRTEERLQEVFENKKFRRFVDKYDHLSKLKVIEAIYFPIGNNGSRSEFVGLLYKDITGEKSIENIGTHSEKLADIGEMTTYILHQMKSPLNSIKMNIDMMGIFKGKKDAREKSLKLIQKEVNRLSKMMKEVMQYSRTSSIKPAKVSVQEIVSEIENSLQPLLREKSISFINELEDKKIIADNDSIITVFYHLIENSIEAIKDGGKIILSSKYDKAKNKLRVYIEDNGSGIASPDKIFQPFFTTKRNGTGLGLSIIKNILSQNNSDIRLTRSEPGRTTFELIFDCGKP